MTEAIHFRSDPTLNRKLDKAAKKLAPHLGTSPSRSTAARYLLSQALGEGLDETLLRESSKRVHGIVQRATNRAVSDVLESLDEYIQEELER